MEMKKAIRCIDQTYVEGNAKELVDKAYRYDDDFSDDAVQEIIDFATAQKEDCRTLIYLLEARQEEKEGKLLLGQIKNDILLYDSAEEFEYNDDTVEIWKESTTGQVLVHITGEDKQGPYHATNAYDFEEFMNRDMGSLESLIGETLFYGTVYDEEVA
ncbi:hypothetical protein bpr_II409 (plasmid) [Butyrivibrio proteoclasticus B316]|uniref:Uncharacterized protein n=1 Tax=Butyrivibrio proteoclasticus (strain ATCC 51982 / DSM 14932 / B316) TaxID=515622 RepID=E0S4L4_BUTPB|nr:hypothetical protein [Butyrivibrio proteoclasticus]ADL36346.1 hypothetical protein bpr_II409 [Butyrivibrio proteoclasticus B316]